MSHEYKTFSIYYIKAVSILPPKCRRQWLGWSYCHWLCR